MKSNKVIIFISLAIIGILVFAEAGLDLIAREELDRAEYEEPEDAEYEEPEDAEYEDAEEDIEQDLDLYRTDLQGSVSVGVTFLNPMEEDEEYLNFGIALNTHSVDLDEYDLSQMTALYLGDGVEITEGIHWTMVEGGGHHVEGMLKIERIQGKSKLEYTDKELIRLEIRNLDDVESKVFEWQQDFRESVAVNYYAYVANTEDGTISVIDTAIDEVVDIIQVDDKISDGLAVNPVNGEIYTANHTGGMLIIIDSETAEVTKKVELNRNLHGVDISLISASAETESLPLYRM